MRLITLLVLLAHASAVAAADKPVTLMGTISQWQYPKSELGDSEMSDAATVDSDGQRTMPSLVCKTTMTTKDSVDQVLAYYKQKLTPDKDADEKAKAALKAGRSVVVSDDSAGRPFSLHTILVNTPTTSTVLVISRGKDEKKTHIVWKHYMRF